MSPKNIFPTIKVIIEERFSFGLIICPSGTKSAVFSLYPRVTALLPPAEMRELGVAATGQNSEQT